MHDICRRMEDESEGKVSFSKLKQIICRTVKVYGYGWLLGLLKLYMLLHCESCYIVTCVMMICHELRFEHLSPVLEMASQAGVNQPASVAPKVGKVLYTLFCLCFDLQASFIAHIAKR